MSNEISPEHPVLGVLKSRNSTGNPWHDPRNGEFTSGPSGARSSSAAPGAQAKENLDLDQITKLVAANNKSGLPDELIIALIYKEDEALNPKQTVKGSTATGLMQITTTALKELARVKDSNWLKVNVTNPAENIQAGTAYIGVLVNLFGGVSVGLNRYGTGPGY